MAKKGVKMHILSIKHTVQKINSAKACKIVINHIMIYFI